MFTVIVKMEKLKNKVPLHEEKKKKKKKKKIYVADFSLSELINDFKLFAFKIIKR